MFRVFVTRPIPACGLALLKKQPGVIVDVYKKDMIIPRRELLRRVKGASAILSILTDCIDAQVMEAAGSELKIIANYAVGFDNIDLQEATKRKIVVTNAPSDSVNESVAEHAIALMFALSHRIVEADNYTRSGKYKFWSPMCLLGANLAGKTVGIIGAGRIGEHVIKRLRDGFDMKIFYSTPKRKPELERKYRAIFKTKRELLHEADFVSLHVPLLPSTRHLISFKEFKVMKKTAFLINTARGSIVDELALVHALQTCQIAGAGLDVCEYEPHIPSVLKKMPNIVLTPHIASSTIEARDDMSLVTAKNILACFNNQKIPNRVSL